MLKKLSVITPVMFALASILSLVVLTQPANAVPKEHVKVTICHRTDAPKHPYVKITVDDDSVDGVAGNSNGNQPDHLGEHTGPVADSVATAQALQDAQQKWGDIIKPQEGITPGSANWTTGGEAIYNNDCMVTDEEEKTADIHFGVVCTDNGALVTLVNEGFKDGDVTVNGEVITVPADSTVTRTLDTGKNGLQITITIDEDVVYDQLVDCTGDVLGDTPVLPTTSGETALLVTGAIASFTLIAGLISLAVRSLLTRQ